MSTATFQGLGAVLLTYSSTTHLRTFATKLMEVGRLGAPKTNDTYKAGQLFLHRLFGYRGVILHPWSARVFDRDKGRKAEADLEINNSDINEEYEKDHTKNTRSTFYNVLIDTRDHPFVQAHKSAVTILRYSDDHNSGLYKIPGLDYASHQDMLPYTPSPGEERPLQHQLVEKFLIIKPGQDPPLVPSEDLQLWQRKNRWWLEVSEVHRETTEKIRVTVIPFFIGHQELLNGVEFWWRYWICLENTGELVVRLRERHWRIFSETGAVETVRGRGVMGQEPVLSPGLPAFQYTGHVSLQAPIGHMWGTLSMEREDGHIFDCKIPKFNLKIKELDDSE